MRRSRYILMMMCFSILTVSAYADWLQFRGTDGSSRVGGSLPVEFGGETLTNVDWRIDLPGRAVGGPIVVGRQVITTASSGHQQKRLHIVSIDTESGKSNWHRRMWATGRTLCHPLGAVAAATPTSDGELIFAVFSSNDVVCLDIDGNVQWVRALTKDWPNAFDDRGLAASPWVSGETLIVPVACAGDSFVFGLSTKNGSTNWKVPLTKDTNWATPCDMTVAGTRYVLLQTADRLLLIEPNSGEVAMDHEIVGAYIPSPCVVGNLVLVPTSGLSALRFDDLDEPTLLWNEAKIASESASPVAVGERCYVLRRPNILTAANLEDGSVAWKTRLSGNGFWATPLISDKHIFVANTDGLVQVVSQSDGEIVGENDLGDEILGSPAASDKAIYFRGTSSLIRVSAS